MLRFRRHVQTLIAALAGLLLLGGVMAPTASADHDYHWKVGWLDAQYWPADGTQYGREYNGLASGEYNVQCVAVQRKSSQVGWTDTHVLGGRKCGGATFEWRITDDLAVERTVAIRLMVTSGAYEGSYFNICSTKTQCLAMRPGRD